MITVMPRVNNGPSTKVGVIWQNSDLWAKNWNFGLKKRSHFCTLTMLWPRPKKNCSRKKVAYAQIGAIWEVSPKHPRDPFHDFCLFYYIVFVFLSATFSSLSIQFEIITNISSSQQNGFDSWRFAHFMAWTYMLKLPLCRLPSLNQFHWTLITKLASERTS